jgi:hypothetical protein
MICEYEMFLYVSMVNIAVIYLYLHMCNAYQGHYDKKILKARNSKIFVLSQI